MNEKKQILNFPKNFLWGTSISAYQVEGENTNDWSEWEKENAQRLAEKGKSLLQWQIKKFPEILSPKNYISGQAADHYKRYKEDFCLLEKLNQNSFRLSLEWSRIEPEEGVFNQSAIDHYREVLEELQKRNIKVFLTIWHWTNPLWVRDQGGWENKKTIFDFVRYVNKVANEYKDLVEIWQPLNEPGTFIGMAYVQGDFPPQVRSIVRANKAFKNLMEAYRQSYKCIHKARPDSIVGMSHYAIKIIPYKNKLINKLICHFVDYIRNWRFLNSIEKTNDFIGLQYYHIDVLNFSFKNRRWNWIPIELKNPGVRVTDMNWDIYPEGIFDLLIKASRYGKPIYITENGLADANDDKREAFIKENLYHIHMAINKGVDVRGYFYWSLLDNFEWDKGFWPRFGLVEVDYKTQERKIRPSAMVYAKICSENKIEI